MWKTILAKPVDFVEIVEKYVDMCTTFVEMAEKIGNKPVCIWGKQNLSSFEHKICLKVQNFIDGIDRINRMKIH